MDAQLIKNCNEMLKLQEIDCNIDQLNFKKASLPQKKELDKTKEALGEIENKLSKLSVIYKNKKIEQDKVEGELKILQAKIEKEKARLYSGKVSNPKELSNIQEELKAFDIKQDELETLVLEKMDEMAKCVEVKQKLTAGQAQKQKIIEELDKEVKTVFEGVDKQLAEIVKERSAQRANVDDEELLEEYDELRKAKNGLAIVKLIEGSCQGCNVELPTTEADQIRSSKELSYCPHCGRMLV